MKIQKKNKSGKLLLYMGIPVVIFIIILRFALFFLKSDGFSGLSLKLPIFTAGILISALLMSVSFSAWVYQDCKNRNDDSLLWAVIVFFTTPFIGLLIYSLRRSEIKSKCNVCGHRVSSTARYCEECGSYLENKEENTMRKINNKRHLSYIAAGVVFMLLMFTCLTGFIVTAVSADGVNKDITSNEKIWNMGVINMNHESYNNGVWKLDFKSASDGFVAQQDMTIDHTKTDILYAEITCGTVPADASLVLWLVQGDVVKSIDVTNLSEPVEYELSEFEKGKIHVRLQINGVKDCTAEIHIK